MRVFRGFEDIPTFHNAVATMGSFDGVHSGHRVLLESVKRIAKECGSESIVLTFDPHPRYVLGTGEDMKLLSTLEEKIYLLEQAGIDNLVVIPFTREFSRTSPQDFIRHNIAALGVSNLVVGYNHRFGHQKEGDYNYLSTHGGDLKITKVEQQQVASSKVSSTVIRQKISEGNIAHANELLSRPYIIMGKSDNNGAIRNIDTHKLLPTDGTYTVKVNGVENVLQICGQEIHLQAPQTEGDVLIEVI